MSLSHSNRFINITIQEKIKMNTETRKRHKKIVNSTTIIIPHYNDNDALLRCLSSLHNQSLHPTNYHINVIDNGSEIFPERVETLFNNITLTSEQKCGSYAARNSGIRNKKSKYIAFTDSDCVPDHEWLQIGTQYLDDHPEVDIIGGRIIITTSPIPSTVELYEKEFAFPQKNYIENLHFSVTANMVIRSTVIDYIGLFNESLLSGGDFEWGNRAYNKGIAIKYLDKMVVNHPARKNLKSIIKKNRRAYGGHYTRKPPIGLLQKIQFMMPRLPLKQQIIPTLKNNKLKPIEKSRILLLIGLLAIVRSVFCTQLLFGQKAKRE